MWGNMIIRTISGKEIYNSSQKTVRGALEEGVAKGVDFAGADLRRARLTKASLDGLLAFGATLWGADLDGADIGFADLRQVDLRGANLKDSCLAGTRLEEADLRGAYFSRTIVEDTVLDGIRVSCPSFWSLELAHVASMKDAVFLHKGEQAVPIDPDRWVVDFKAGRLVVNYNHCLFDGRIYDKALAPPLRRNLVQMRKRIDGILARDSENARNPIPKRVNSAKRP